METKAKHMPEQICPACYIIGCVCDELKTLAKLEAQAMMAVVDENIGGQG